MTSEQKANLLVGAGNKEVKKILVIYPVGIGRESERAQVIRERNLAFVRCIFLATGVHLSA